MPPHGSLLTWYITVMELFSLAPICLYINPEWNHTVVVSCSVGGTVTMSPAVGSLTRTERTSCQYVPFSWAMVALLKGLFQNPI